MNKIVVLFFLLCIGLIILIITMQTNHTKDGEFSGGLLILYGGCVILYYNRKKEKHEMAGLRFRGLVTGISCVAGGLYLLFSYFFLH